MYKFTVFLKSGHKVKFKCSEYKFEFDNSTFEYTGYELKNMKPYVSIVPSQIAGYIRKNRLF